ncbi:MAG TPA: amidohydrolase [Lachnospiraceae bacterium]|nr:amidohydrolase [Lachnospiraceae bacterium]
MRTEALQGAELILIPTANTLAEPLELFEQEIRVQAYQNECCIAMCNRTGKEEGMSFAGQSLLVDPDGNTILKAGEIPGLFLATVDLDRVQEARNERPYLTLRRKEWYL